MSLTPWANSPPAVMTIAGTDSSGGAGIQADLKTFTALGCYGTSVVTALTAQNTTGVQAVHAPPPEFTEQQLRSVLDDVEIRGIKTGMLFSADIVRTVARTLSAHYAAPSGSAPPSTLPPLVCDPVCVSTSGHTLLATDALDVLISELLPLATLVTPNTAEAALLLSTRGLPSAIGTLEDMIRAAKDLRTLGCAAVLLKGGHLEASEKDLVRLRAARPDITIVRDCGLLDENMEILRVAQGSGLEEVDIELVVDVLCDAEHGEMLFVRPRLDSTSTHGTGCTLSAALACALARGLDVVDAVKIATAYTHQGIAQAFPVGKGFGPLNHLHSITPRVVPRPTASNPHPLTRYLIASTPVLWKEYVQHDFVVQLGKGTLPRDCFVHFIKQDYQYLKYYARAYGLLAAKAPSYPALGAAAEVIGNIVRESTTQIALCAEWGVSRAELEAAPTSPATAAYGAYLLDAGLSGDYARLIIALSACLLGYGEVGLWLRRESLRPAADARAWVVSAADGNPYARWMDEYASEWYQGAVRAGVAAIEACASGADDADADSDAPTPARLAEWREVWTRCTAFEKAFWDMALQLA